MQMHPGAILRLSEEDTRVPKDVGMPYLSCILLSTFVGDIFMLMNFIRGGRRISEQQQLETAISLYA